MDESYTTEQASQHAVEWCKKHKGWKRICDIENSDSLYYNWDEIEKKEKDYWINSFGEYSAESAWREFGIAKCKVKKGYITGKGEFYKNILEVPLFHNLMTILKVGAENGL